MINKRLDKETEEQILDTHDPTYSSWEQDLAWKIANISSPFGLPDREYERLMDTFYPHYPAYWAEADGWNWNKDDEHNHKFKLEEAA